MAFPVVPAKSQYDGGPLQNANCTVTSGARLLRYGTGINVTGSRVRAQQSDQSGGTSIPDVMRALHKGWSFEPHWAAPNDSNAGRDPVPANRVGDWITAARLNELLDADYMVLVQGDYGEIPDRFTLSDTFNGDHAFTVDGRHPDRGYYVVDTLFRGTTYDGQWLPVPYLLDYAYGLSGNGRIYAAWARPLPDTSTEDAMYSLPWSDVDGPTAVTVDANTPVYDSGTDTTPRSTLNDPDKPFVAVSGSKDGKRVAIYGRYRGAPVRLGWVDTARCNR